MTDETLPSGDEIVFDQLEPDYETPCENCGARPTVTGVKASVVIFHSGLCGPCFFGDASSLDPSTW